MTLDQLNQTIYLLNAAKISQRQKAAVLGIAIESILTDGDIDVQEAFRRYAGIDEDIARFLQSGDFPEEIGAEELYRRYVAWSDHPVSMTRFGREIKSMGVGYASTRMGMKYYFNKKEDTL